ncbi:MAG: hypothetical protein HY518_04910 [Candidatus Aenigmarchaeota archaeon]|nr:hypothetical protein [Candidatus Aenigmarchaeota archaeon]
MKKGFVFSLDAIIAASILILLTVFLAGLSFTYTSPELRYERLYLTGKDVLSLMQNTRMSYIKDFQTVGSYYAQGVLTQEDDNKTVLDIIGSLWSTGNATDEQRAADLAQEFLNRTIPARLGYEMSFDNQVIYQQNSTANRTFLARLSTIASGFQKGKPVSGYVARAFAVKAKTNITEIFPFEPAGAGNSGGAGDKLNITKRFFVNATKILNSTLIIAEHSGNSDPDAQNEFYMNGQDITARRQIIENPQTPYGDYVLVYTFNVSDITVSGWNRISLVLFRSGSSNTGRTRLNPGGGVEVTYSTDFTKLVVNNTFNYTQYFDSIVSKGKQSDRPGVFAAMPVYVPSDAAVTNATMYLNWQGVADDASRPDVQVFFNDKRIYLNTTPLPNSFISLNLTGNISQNAGRTNVVAVYINTNTSLNDFWGPASEVRLFSDPQNKPSNSSKIFVEYFRPPQNVKFGYIDINQVQHFSGLKANPKDVTLFFNGTPIDRSFLHVVQLDNKNTSVKVQPQGYGQAQIFQTPLNFSLPSSVYIDPVYYNISVNNTVTANDTCTSTCEITSLSTVEYGSLIKSIVGFGGVYPNATAAVEDAKERLKQVLGSFITATEIEVLNSSVKGVPSLWGPAKLEIRMWS